MSVFDRSDVQTGLADLSEWQRVAFAVSCIEILVPSYARFAAMEGVGDPELVRTAVDAVWSWLRASPSGDGPADLPPSSSVRSLVPAEDDWNEWAPQAEDAVASLYYLLEFLQTDDVQFLNYVAERAFSAVDELTARQMDLGVIDEPGRRALAEASAVQAELARQQEAMRVIRNSADGDESVLGWLKTTSESLAVGGRP
jgi:uncharacterized protein YjaG (DUF416 family)